MYYVRSAAELIDFLKDVQYSIIVMHQSLAITMLLWFFALFAVTYTAVSILIMTRRQYMNIYGINDM